MSMCYSRAGQTRAAFVELFARRSRQRTQTVSPADAFLRACACRWARNPQGTAHGVPSQSHENYSNSRTGLMTFFTNSLVGTDHVSENGHFNAQCYWRDIKPQVSASDEGCERGWQRTSCAAQTCG
jgi:hypothetical protein